MHTALSRTGKTPEVLRRHDVKEIARRGVIFTPAVVIDSQVRLGGKVPSVEEIGKPPG